MFIFFSRSGKKTFMFPQCFLFVCLLSPENLKLLACYCVIFHVFVLLHLFLMASETSSYLIPLLPSLSVYSWWKSELRVFFLCTCDSKPPHFQVWDLFWFFFPHLLLFIIFYACCISVPGPVVFIPALRCGDLFQPTQKMRKVCPRWGDNPAVLIHHLLI